MAVENKYANQTSFSLTTKATVHGTQYSRGMILCIGNGNGFPEFGQIDHILICGTEVAFIVHRLTSWYIEHFRAYEINQSTHCDVAIVTPQELVDFYPLTAYNVDGRRMVVPKRFLLG